MPTVIHQLADAFLRRKEAAQGKSVFPEDSFMPKSSKQDLANRLSVFEQGGTTELLKQAGKEMYENPVVNTAISLTPGAGDIQSAFEAMKSAKEGDWTGAGLNAVGILPFVPALKTVWHGSPHSFEKFDLSKIGTGEGAQAYGHGLYFAEKPEIARSYQESLSTGPERFLVNGEEVLRREAKGPMLDVSDPKTAAIVYASREGDKGARKYFKTQGAWGQKAIAELDAMKGQTITNELPGSLYKVDLPDEQIAKMLDWDKPLSEQPESVRNALQGIEKELPEIADFNLRNWMEADPLASTWHNAVVRDLGVEPAELSAKLQQRGIPGLQYFDSGSRGGGDGTRNYVVFSDEIPKILERNGTSVFEFPK